MLDIGPPDSFDLFKLERTITVVEAFRFVACRSCQVFIGLELPVCPANEVLIRYIAHIRNFDGTAFSIHAGTEFTNEQRDSKMLCILVSFSNSCFMPLSAHILYLRSLLVTHHSLRTAVSVIIQSMVWRTNSCSRRLFESKLSRVGVPMDVEESIPDLTWLKEHD